MSAPDVANRARLADAMARADLAAVLEWLAAWDGGRGEAVALTTVYGRAEWLAAWRPEWADEARNVNAATPLEAACNLARQVVDLIEQRDAAAVADAVNALRRRP